MDENLEMYKQLIIGGNDTACDTKEIKSIIEGLLFTAGEPLSMDDISSVLQINKSVIRKLLVEMIDEYNFERRGIQIILFNDKCQMCTRPEHIEFIKRLLRPQNKQSLSRAALETTAIIAYKQPITRQAIDSIRGVKSDRIIINLVLKKLIKELGRMDTPGRPILYGTTDDFLKYFGLRDLSELPKLDDFKIEV